MLASVASVKAQQTRMNVIGNNLANVNTTAYKGSRVTFQEMMSQTMRGASRPSDDRGGLNPMQYGLGVLVSGVSVSHEQGSLQATNRPTDLAIQGNGFFVVSDGDRLQYTRDGAFALDANGDLVHTATGNRMTGWTANPVTDEIDTEAPINFDSKINIPVGLRTAVQATTTIEWGGNLDSRSPIGNTTRAVVRIYDSLGAQHDLTLNLTKTAEDTWDWTVATGSTATVTGNGTFTFDPTNGSIATGGLGSITVDPNGGVPPFTSSVSFEKVSQVASDTQVIAASQNGFPPGSLSGFSISTQGLITGIYTNGLTRSLAQVAIANFTNPGGLERQGSNLFRDTDNSGTPVIGTAGAGGRGLVSSGFLEQSNVDIGQEFSDLIITQRGFQANTRVVTTVDEMLQDLINMKR
ncbi:MAG: flagellar hook protein FlgE [Fimbriimonadaceae bacterium]|nr:flagellar hook protein FlgE [Fimbriimonadaceae bacterium]